MFDFSNRATAVFAIKPREPLESLAIYILAPSLDAMHDAHTLLVPWPDEGISVWNLCTPAQLANIPIQPALDALAVLIVKGTDVSDQLYQECLRLLSRTAAALQVAPESLVEYI